MLAANKLTPNAESSKKEASVIQMSKEVSASSKEEQGLVKSWLAKLMFTLISIKTWGIVASMAVSSWLLVYNQSLIASGVSAEAIGIGITGTQWITFNTTIWTMLFGINEVKKAYQRKDKAIAEGKVKLTEKLSKTTK